MGTVPVKDVSVCGNYSRHGSDRFMLANTTVLNLTSTVAILFSKGTLPFLVRQGCYTPHQWPRT